MLDTVHIAIVEPRIIPSLSGQRTIHTRDTGSEVVVGNMKNFGVRVSPGGNIRMRGSLASYIHGHNFNVLTRQQCGDALALIAGEFGVDLDQLNLSRIDFGPTFEVSHPVRQYLDSMITIGGLKRSMNYKNNSLYFSNHWRQVVVYDKAKESCRLGNRLRFELRLIKNSRNQLGVAALNGSTLLDNETYSAMLCHLESAYNEMRFLEPQAQPVPNSNPKACVDDLAAFALRMIGQQQYLDQITPSVTDRNKRYRVRRKILALLETKAHPKTAFQAEMNHRMGAFLDQQRAA